MKNHSAYIRAREYLYVLIKKSRGDADMLPPERQLAEVIGVNRLTLRKVIATLVADGVIESRQGSGNLIVPKSRRARREYNFADSKPTVGLILAGGTPNMLLSSYYFQAATRAAEVLSAGQCELRLVILENSGPIATEQLAKQGFSAILWIGPPVENLELIESLRERNIPVVMIGGELYRHRHLSYVGADDVAGGRIAAECLWQNGHRKILMIDDNLNRCFVNDRCRGMKSFLARQTSGKYSLNMLKVNDFFDLYNRLDMLLTEDPDSFTALFCSDGIYLNVICEVFEKHGLRIGKDRSLLLYDRIKHHHLTNPTQLVQQLEVYGEAAGRGVLEFLFNRRTAPFREMYAPVLLAGDSVCRMVEKNPSVAARGKEQEP